MAENNDYKLIGYKTIKGIIEVLTGLHIGGSTSIIEIGGRDNPVIRHPVTKEPYIPGSSLKGKMRSLLEWKLGKITIDVDKKGDVHSCGEPDCPICVLFGTSADESQPGPARLIFRDAILDEDYKTKCKKRDDNWTTIDITEEKFENAINRITARANPRNFERVVSGAEFRFSISYRDITPGIINNDEFFKHVIDGLKLIEMDALGGAGSRGCGQVKFLINVNIDGKDETLTLDDIVCKKTEGEKYAYDTLFATNRL